MHETHNAMAIKQQTSVNQSVMAAHGADCILDSANMCSHDLRRVGTGYWVFGGGGVLQVVTLTARRYP